MKNKLMPPALIALAACALLVTMSLNSSWAAAADSGLPLVVMYAFPAEGEVLLSKMTVDSTARVLGRTVQIGSLNGRHIVLAESGVGMTNAAMTTQALIDRFSPQGLVFSGIAGAIDTMVHIGDMCVCSQWIDHDYLYLGPDSTQPVPIRCFSAQVDSVARFWSFPVDSSYLAGAKSVVVEQLSLQKIGERSPRLFIEGNGVTGNAFIDNADKRRWLSGRFGALVTDMESAAVAQVCTVNGLPFVIVRAASDLAGGSGDATAEEQLNQFFQIAAGNSAAVVIALIARLP